MRIQAVRQATPGVTGSSRARDGQSPFFACVAICFLQGIKFPTGKINAGSLKQATRAKLTHFQPLTICRCIDNRCWDTTRKRMDCDVIVEFVHSNTHRPRGLVHRCRLRSSWWCISHQRLGCSSIKDLHELGSERRETVR